MLGTLSADLVEPTVLHCTSSDRTGRPEPIDAEHGREFLDAKLFFEPWGESLKRRGARR